MSYSSVASISKWGNSQGVRLANDVLRHAKLSLSDQVVIRSEPGRVVIEKAKPKYVLADLLAQIPEGETLALVDYGRAMGRELP
jgi:antitoxin MazE